MARCKSGICQDMFINSHACRSCGNGMREDGLMKSRPTYQYNNLSLIWRLAMQKMEKKTITAEKGHERGETSHSLRGPNMYIRTFWAMGMAVIHCNQHTLAWHADIASISATTRIYHPLEKSLHNYASCLLFLSSKMFPSVNSSNAPISNSLPYCWLPSSPNFSVIFSAATPLTATDLSPSR